MTYPNASTALAAVIVDELVHQGVRRAVIAPGSRSTALVLALDANEDIDVVVHIDERSAGFRALGHAIGGVEVGLVVTTSGSAVANLLPAVVEADRASVPLVVLSADRPREMVDRRTNQTMDQESVFSGYLRLWSGIGPGRDVAGENTEWRKAVFNSVTAATGAVSTPGPVQINVAFEEPTVPVSDDGRVQVRDYTSSTERVDADHHGNVQAIQGAEHTSRQSVDLGDRALVIAGRGDYDALALMDVAHSHGVPVLGTALSGTRGANPIVSYHHLLVDGVPSGLEPESVVVVGQPGPSNRVDALLRSGAPVLHIDRWGLHTDPVGSVSERVAEDPVEFMGRVARSQKAGWAEAWREADGLMGQALSDAIGSSGVPTGPGVASALDEANWSALVVGSSLPIRDVDAYSRRAGWIHSNRGVSGIDGFVSTALGVADERERTVALAGDLTFLHDSNGLLNDRPSGLVFVVVDNNGGGLFDLLPQSEHAPNFERLFVTPPDRDLDRLAEFHRLDYSEATSLAELVVQVDLSLTVGRPSLIRVAVDRGADAAFRGELDEIARSALSA